MRLLGLIAFFSFISTLSYAECDFRTADYIEGMVSPEKLNPYTLKSLKALSMLEISSKYSLQNHETFQIILKRALKLMSLLLMISVYVDILERSDKVVTGKIILNL